MNDDWLIFFQCEIFSVEKKNIQHSTFLKSPISFFFLLFLNLLFILLSPVTHAYTLTDLYST